MQIIDWFKRAYDRHKKARDVRFSFDILIPIAHIAIVVYAIYLIIQVPLHTSLHFNKDDKGEITFAIDYNANIPNEMEMEEAKDSVNYFKNLGIKAVNSLLKRKKTSEEKKRPIVKAKTEDEYKSYVNPKAKEEDPLGIGIEETKGEVDTLE